MITRKKPKKRRKVTKNDIEIVKVVLALFGIILTGFTYWVSKSVLMAIIILAIFGFAYFLIIKDYETIHR